ncbi:apolipoprotein N-acyltransferase [Pseudonocardia sp. NPDC049635]|uniref:apolipoprotein N-acyltransferase n=1 Tax=Pseudonocardia sp. NPDC049635 TaxID=3155506 RepID=UPI0034003A8A
MSGVVTGRADGPGGRSTPRERLRALRSVPLRHAAALPAGVLLHLAFPPRLVWWTAPIAFALLWWALQRTTVRRAALIGFVFGLAFFLPHLVWIENFLGQEFGPAPWVGLSALMAVFTAAFGAVVPLLSRLPGAPLWAAAAFVLQEALRGRIPLNGFPWGRVAFSQAEGPYLPLAAFGGAPLVTFAVVATGFTAAALVTRPTLLRAVPVLLLVVALVGVPAPPADAQAGTRTVALVQGNAPDLGLGLLGARDLLRRNHLAVTAELADEIRAGTVPRPDLVLWPEGATGTDGTDPAIDRAVADLGVPTLIGAMYRHADGTENAVVAWDPRTGPGERYAKQELVPFAERIPLRPIASLVTPFVDVPDLLAGGRPGRIDLADTRLGVGICYEVAYDWVLREAAGRGAQLLVVPTDNAWYGPGEMTYQQLAMARLRAVEHGRAVVVPALSGVSAVVRPDGSVARSTEMYTAATVVEQVPLRTDVTPATRWGGAVEMLFVAAAVGGCLAGAVRHRRRRTGRP